ncbi:cation efflux protein, CzcI family [Herbaspirillum sp. ST 5-3]|uniref:cation efflux protein, CzcI family n=1 Tax=Oxalobacteraceae TaxID=75682 RepID=UPI0010A366C1|nr:cation efflux protein, CzcI family [Herbaspirillum sp. ST 5-3]
MKKFLLIFLLMLLPYQFSWAAAAVYCQHETERTTQHFGHHSHAHDAKSDTVKDSGNPFKIHTDCEYCHLACQSPFVAEEHPIVVPDGLIYSQTLPALSYSSHIPDGPRRPDWRLVA